MVKGVTISYKTAKYEVTGAKLAGSIDKGILKIESGVLKTAYPTLLRYIVEKGDYSVMRLIAQGATIDVLEKIAVKGADFSAVYFATKNAKTAVWLEEGTVSWGWRHIVSGSHDVDIANALTIKLSEVQGVLLKTVTNYDKVVATSDSFEFYKAFSTAKGSKTIKVVVSTTAENAGRIITAFPA